MSAFNAIPTGQWEGGAAIGLRKLQVMRLVIFPQLIRLALPALANLWLVLIKDTAYVSAIALNDASPYKPLVEDGYPALAEAAQALTDAGAAFFDATRIFDGERTPVYIDDCCHYTLQGNQLLADFIASAILATPGPWSQ